MSNSFAPRPLSSFRALAMATFAVVGLFAASARAEVCDEYGDVDDDVAAVLSLVAQGVGVQAPVHWSLEAADGFAQQWLVRPAQAERSSVQAAEHFRRLFSALSAPERQRVEAHLRRTGFLDAATLPTGDIDYVLINGSTAPTVRARIYAVAEAVDRGELSIRPDTEVYIVDGERPLFASETDDVLVNSAPFESDPDWVRPAKLPTDERALNEMLWGQMLLPEALREHDIVFIHASRRPPATRAHTKDAIRQWATLRRPQGGTALVVSNNPFVEYQRRVTELVLRRNGYANVRVVAMGPAASFEHLDTAQSFGMTLDALAGTLSAAAKYFGVSMQD